MGNALRRDLFCQKRISLVLVQFKASFIQMCVITPVLDKCGGSRWAQSHRAALLTIGFQLLSALQHRVMWNRLAQLWMCYWSYLYCPAFLRAVQSTGKSVVVEEQCRSTSHREKFICVFADRLWAAGDISKALGICTGACQETVLLLGWFVIGRQTLNVCI